MRSAKFPLGLVIVTGPFLDIISTRGSRLSLSASAYPGRLLSTSARRPKTPRSAANASGPSQTQNRTRDDKGAICDISAPSGQCRIRVDCLLILSLLACYVFHTPRVPGRPTAPRLKVQGVPGMPDIRPLTGRLRTRKSPTPARCLSRIWQKKTTRRAYVIQCVCLYWHNIQRSYQLFHQSEWTHSRGFPFH